MAALIAQYLPRILTLIDYYRAPAPKARNIIARGKREAQRNASPLDPKNNSNRALKVRNINVNYSALSELHDHCARVPGATRLTLFGACPWLSYFAPSALPHSRCPWLSYFAPSALPQSRCPWLSYFAPSALPHSRCPWLSYFAPSALPHSRCPWLSYFAPSALQHSRCPWLSYFAPSALPHSRCPWLFIFRA